LSGWTFGLTRDGKVQGQANTGSPLLPSREEQVSDGVKLFRSEVCEGYAVEDTPLSRIMRPAPSSLYLPDHLGLDLDRAPVRLQVNLKIGWHRERLLQFKAGATFAHVARPACPGLGGFAAGGPEQEGDLDLAPGTPPLQDRVGH
jgi:hypothetical protein